MVTLCYRGKPASTGSPRIIHVKNIRFKWKLIYRVAVGTDCVLEWLLVLLRRHFFFRVIKEERFRYTGVHVGNNPARFDDALFTSDESVSLKRQINR